MVGSVGEEIILVLGNPCISNELQAGLLIFYPLQHKCRLALSFIMGLAGKVEFLILTVPGITHVHALPIQHRYHLNCTQETLSFHGGSSFHTTTAVIFNLMRSNG